MPLDNLLRDREPNPRPLEFVLHLKRHVAGETGKASWRMMLRGKSQGTILCAEDDPDDRLLIAEAFAESGLLQALHFVEDGEELLEYLRGESPRSGQPPLPRPSLILLDLNMPRKDGREALKELKSDPELRPIPVVVLTTSMAEEDIRLSYDLYANSFVVKPARFDSLVQLFRSLGQYWFSTAQLPFPG